MKKNGKLSKSKKIDREREAQVLLERMHSDIQRIAEAQSSTGTQIAEIKSAIADMPTKSEVNTITMAVMTISGDVKGLTNDVKDLKNDVNGLKNKVDENLSNHERRITKLEEKVFV